MSAHDNAWRWRETRKKVRPFMHAQRHFTVALCVEYTGWQHTLPTQPSSIMLSSRTLASLCLLLAAPAMADTTLLCIRGKSFQPGREFLQTRQLALQIDGPPLGDALWPLARHAVREQLWPELQLDEVFVSPFDAELCGHEPRAQLQLRLDQREVSAIQAERHRGPAAQPRLHALARSAHAQAAPAKGLPNVSPAPPPNAQPSEEPQAPARSHQWLRLYFATSRAPTGHADAAQAFSATPHPDVSFGAVAVSIPSDHRWARLESPSVFRLEFDSNPNRHIQLDSSYQRLSAATWRQQLTTKARGLDKGGVLLFVHGYNNSFADAAQRAAQLAHDLAFPGPTVLFSWPSGDTELGYFADEEKARTTWRQMADVLDQLTHLSPDAPVYIIAHSMGNRILTQGLAELLRQRPGADRALRQVVLASPDIGREEFRQRWLHELKSANAPRYTLYASRQDIPVRLSGWLHGERRLGAGGAETFVTSGLDSIDASAITQEWFSLSHSYFGDNQSVMNDLFQIIHHGQPPAQRARLRPSTGTYGQYWEFQP